MNQCLRTCFMVLVFTTVGEIVVLTALVIYWRRERESQAERVETPKEQHVCIPYDNNVNVKEDESCPDGLKKEINGDKNVSVCCGQMSYVLECIIPKVIHRSYKSDVNPELSNLNLTKVNCETNEENIPIVNLQGIDRNREHGEKIFWNQTESSNTTTGVLEYFPNNGTVFIDQPGFYFIQSQIVIKLGNTNGHDTNKTLKHFVHLLSNNGHRKTLLENENHKYKIAASQSKRTSIMGAVFKLESGDQLYVRTSHPNSLVPDNINNYLSIHGV